MCTRNKLTWLISSCPKSRLYNRSLAAGIRETRGFENNPSKPKMVCNLIEPFIRHPVTKLPGKRRLQRHQRQLQSADTVGRLFLLSLAFLPLIAFNVLIFWRNRKCAQKPVWVALRIIRHFAWDKVTHSAKICGLNTRRGVALSGAATLIGIEKRWWR